MQTKKVFRKLFLTVMVSTAVSAQAQTCPSELLGHETEIDNIIKQMTLEEKIDMLHGKNMFSSAGIPRLGIADVEYADGPFGIREEMATALEVARRSSHIERPIKELKGFQRVALKAGERKTVTIPVRRTDLCHWDESAQTWMLEPGSMTILVGGSSDHLPLITETTLN